MWLSQPVSVLLWRHVRNSKHEPLVDKVELLHATPTYVQLRFSTGREANVSLRDIAPVTEHQSFSPEMGPTIHDKQFDNSADANKSDNV